MKNLGITKGEAKVILGTSDSFAKVELGKRTLDLRSLNLESKQYKEENANAQLIANAFNTANKTNMLPSELLEQRDELLEMLKLCKDTTESQSMFNQCNELINDIQSNEQ